MRIEWMVSRQNLKSVMYRLRHSHLRGCVSPFPLPRNWSMFWNGGKNDTISKSLDKKRYKKPSSQFPETSWFPSHKSFPTYPTKFIGVYCSEKWFLPLKCETTSFVQNVMYSEIRYCSTNRENEWRRKHKRIIVIQTAELSWAPDTGDRCGSSCPCTFQHNFGCTPSPSYPVLYRGIPLHSHGNTFQQPYWQCYFMNLQTHTYIAMSFTSIKVSFFSIAAWSAAERGDVCIRTTKQKWGLVAYMTG